MDKINANDRLFEAILSLKDKEECRSFFGDICTPKEIATFAQRFAVAEMLHRGCVYSEIVSAIRRIAAGKRVVSPEIEHMLENDPPIPDLSPRQRDILESITRGLTNAQIALQLDISPESVKTHIAKLFEKLDAASRSEAVSIAIRRHLLKI